MTTEIEIKVLDICQKNIENKIQKLGAHLQGDWLMETLIFDYPDRRLTQNKSYVRIRSEGEEIKCTYKTPLGAQDQHKIMQEHEVTINDTTSMKNILLGLGLEVILHFEKKRKHYVYNEFVFDIDTLPNIPTYLEIEAPSSEKLTEMLVRLDIPVDTANAMGPKEVLAHYGLNIDTISEMKF